MDLKNIRNKIDNVDDKIIELISKRMTLVNGVIQYKKDNNIQSLDTNREKDMIARIKNVAKEKNLEPEFAQKILKILIEHSREYQDKFL